jgi:hypothetical protein
MSTSSDLLNAPREFLKLFSAGKEAARQGDKARAHLYFRRAIEVDPYHELVWLWLASVVMTDEDRRACFENVLELNPDNATARRQLQKLEHKALVEMIHVRERRNILWRRRLFWAVIVLVLVISGIVTVWIYVV